MKPIKEINIKVIPHSEQKYETVGNYWRDSDGSIQIRISELPRNTYELIVAAHEFFEVILTEARGIPERAITDFDIAFENERRIGNEDEPGDDINAPYRLEHCIATAVERLMCSELYESWKNYDEECKKLHKE